MSYKISTEINDNKIIQETSVTYLDIKTTTLSEIMDVKEKQIQEALIKLGWKPPISDNDDNIESIENLVNFNDLVQSAIILNKQCRKLVNKNSFLYNKWLKEFCTVHIYVGRGSGESTYICNNMNEDTLLIVPEYKYIDYYKKMKISFIENVLCPLDKYSYRMKTNSVYSTIFIDQPQKVFQNLNELDFFRDIACPNKEQIIIMFGH